MSRISFEELALNIAIECSKRSEDPYKKVGCCILNKNGRVLSTGYNGLIPKFNPNINFWQDRDFRRKFMIHAEVNALSRISIDDEPYVLAVTLLPCSNCAVNIASYGIKQVVYKEDYDNDQNAKDIFKFYNINLLKSNERYFTTNN